jgi:hypothetical protein
MFTDMPYAVVKSVLAKRGRRKLGRFPPLLLPPACQQACPFAAFTVLFMLRKRQTNPIFPEARRGD